MLLSHLKRKNRKCKIEDFMAMSLKVLVDIQGKFELYFTEKRCRTVILEGIIKKYLWDRRLKDEDKMQVKGNFVCQKLFHQYYYFCFNVFKNINEKFRRKYKKSYLYYYHFKKYFYLLEKFQIKNNNVFRNR